MFVKNPLNALVIVTTMGLASLASGQTADDPEPGSSMDEVCQQLALDIALLSYDIGLKEREKQQKKDRLNQTDCNANPEACSAIRSVIALIDREINSLQSMIDDLIPQWCLCPNSNCRTHWEDPEFDLRSLL